MELKIQKIPQQNNDLILDLIIDKVFLFSSNVISELCKTAKNTSRKTITKPSLGHSKILFQEIKEYF